MVMPRPNRSSTSEPIRLLKNCDTNSGSMSARCTKAERKSSRLLAGVNCRKKARSSATLPSFAKAFRELIRNERISGP